MSVSAPATFQGTPGVAIREDQFIIHVGVTGPPAINFPSTFSWTSKEGGDVSAQNVNTRPGGLMPAVDLGGPASRSDCTVKRQYTTALDPYVKLLEAGCGNARMWITWTPIDANQVANGATHGLTGVLKEVQVPAYDANAAAAGFITLVMSCDEAPSS